TENSSSQHPAIPNILISEDEEDKQKRKPKRQHHHHLSKHNTVGEIKFHASNPNLVKTQHRAKSPDKPKHFMMRQRMSSDTDLWLSLNAERSLPLSALNEAPNETSEIIVNPVRMPSLDEEEAPVPAPVVKEERKTLNQEDVIKRLKAKQALFSKGRSISIASFKFPSSSMGLGSSNSSNSSKSSSKKTPPPATKDDKFLAQNSIRGELDLLNLDKLINVQDLRKKSA
ncbi:Anoctamin, partial [Caligus rogercresseyi]